MDFQFRIGLIIPMIGIRGGASGGDNPSQPTSAGRPAIMASNTSSTSSSASSLSSGQLTTDATASTTTGSSLIGAPNLEILRCPVCLDFPRKNIYQCSNGHSICHYCVEKTTECCICRLKYDGVRKIRNLLVESLLDSMKLDCEYKYRGCLEKLPRTEMTWHESQCSHNQNAMKLSLLFDDVRSKSVAKKHEIQICPKTLLMDLDYADALLDRMSKAPLNIPFRQVIRGARLSIEFPLPRTNGKDGFAPVSLMELLAAGTNVLMGYFALIQRTDVDKKSKQAFISWTVVGFTGESRMHRLDHPLVSCSIKPFQRNIRESFGRGNVATLNWVLEAVSLDDWKGFMSTPSEERPFFPFKVPECLLKDYYIDEYDNCTLQFMFN